MNFWVNIVVGKIQGIIADNVHDSFKQILKSHGIISALSFIVCLCVMFLFLRNVYITHNNINISKKQIEIIQRAAQDGNHDAQKELGDLYFNGIVLSQDYKKAFKCYINSAAQGNKDALFQIGVMYQEGKGIPIDYRKAYLYYTLSYLNGNTHANFDGMYQMRKRKLLPLTEIEKVTVEAQNMAKQREKK